MKRTRIKRAPGIPKHEALRAILLREIRSGQWSSGTRLPSEQELIAFYGVSNTTVRHCLSDLVREGYLVRHRRRGTFVTELADSKTAAKYALLCSSLAVGFHAPFFLNLVASMEEQITKSNGSMGLLSSRDIERSNQPGQAAADLARQHGYDGIFVASPLPEEWVRVLIEQGPPVVLLQIDYPNLTVPRIMIDETKMLRLALDHLVQLGHRSVAVLFGHAAGLGRMSDSRLTRAEKSIQEITAEAYPEVHVAFLKYNYFDVESIKRLALPLLRAGQERATAVIVHEEGAAHLVKDMAVEAGWSVPEDLSLVISETGSPYSRFTASEPEIANLCWRAVRLMEQLIGGASVTRMREFVGANLVVRESTAPPRRER